HRADRDGSAAQLLSMDATALSSDVPAGERGRPFTAATFDLAHVEYVEEEWFLRGDARAYTVATGSALTGDGRWSVEHADAQTFTTRPRGRGPPGRRSLVGRARGRPTVHDAPARPPPRRSRPVRRHRRARVAQRERRGRPRPGGGG